MKMKILFIENHSTFAKIVVQMFLSDHQIKIVPSMKLALKELELNRDYKVALIDYDLDDCKGNKVALIIKQLYPNIKIIATSSHLKGNNLILKAGADATCPKMDFSNIQSVIKSVF